MTKYDSEAFKKWFKEGKSQNPNKGNLTESGLKYIAGLIENGKIKKLKELSDAGNLGAKIAQEWMKNEV